MYQPVLLIMAAGMGSRYGGLKQMDPVGPSGEVILHYSIYDAHRAGFRKVIFLIKEEMEKDFREVIGNPVSKYMEVRYCYQHLEDLPAPFHTPEERKKPWGTGHAVLCCRDAIGSSPFCVINADDYYGPGAMKHAYDFLSHAQDDEKHRWMMVGYHLKNTTSRHGHVARGVCVTEEGYLRDIHERTHIVESSDGPLFTEDGEHYTLLDPDTLVSMNLWGFTPSVLDELGSRFPGFLEKALKEAPASAEFFLPTVVSECIHAGTATVEVLSSPDQWFGMTYREDRAVVVQALKDRCASGLYPERLFP